MIKDRTAAWARVRNLLQGDQTQKDEAIDLTRTLLKESDEPRQGLPRSSWRALGELKAAIKPADADAWRMWMQFAPKETI